MAILHILPVGDLIAHEDDGVDCPCGPDVEYLISDAGAAGKLVTHHSLDGRERRQLEPGGGVHGAPL